jgi:hypothetical protein
MAAVYALCAAYVVYCLATNPAGPITTPDSIRYLESWPMYPLGYPLFLKIFGADGAIIAQPIIFGGALAFLGGEIVRLTRRQWLAVAIIIGNIALPQIREFHASILTESLFNSLLVVFLALALRFAYHSTWRLMVPIALVAGLSVTIRRTGFALLPLMLIMVLFERHRLKGSQPALFLVAALAPFFVIVGAEQAIAPIVHRGHASSLSGRHMFAKAALVDAPALVEASTNQPLTADDRLRAALNRQLEIDYAPIREFLAAAPRDIRAVLSIYYETCLQGGCVDRSRALMPGMDEADQTKILGSAGFARIAAAPAAFLDLWALNYESLWTVDRLRNPARTNRLNAFIAAHRPMPFENLAFSLEPNQVFAFVPSPRVRYLQWAVTALAIVTGIVALIGIVALVTPSSVPPLTVFAIVSALGAHGALLLTALLAAGFARFTLGVWPLIITAAIAGLYCALMFARPLRSTNF